MRRAFADTFYFLALLNHKDSAHEAALSYYGASGFGIVTTEWILTEVADAHAMPALRQGCHRLLDTLRNDPGVTIVPSCHDLWERGLRLFFDRPDKAWSLTDCISFVVMRDHKITHALTADRHFAQAGFAVLL